MASKQHLPFPQLVELFPECLSCGYPLEGIPVPGNCPECGLMFDPPPSALLVRGVAKSSGGPKWRKLVWVLIAIFAFIYTQLLGLILLSYPWVGLIIFVALIAVLSAMLMTTKQKKKGTECFVFNRSGFSRWTKGSDPTTRIFTHWPGLKRGVQINRVGTVWASLKLVSVEDDGKHTTDFQCGFRCRDHDIPLIQEIMDAFTNGSLLDEIDFPEHCSLFDTDRAVDQSNDART